MAVSIGNPSRIAPGSQTSEGVEPLGVPEGAAEAIKAGKLEAVTVRQGDTLWDLWSQSKRGTWDEFKSLNSHLTADPRRDSGNLIVPGDAVLMQAATAQAPAAKAQPWQAASKAKAPAAEASKTPSQGSAAKAAGSTAADAEAAKTKAADAAAATVKAATAAAKAPEGGASAKASATGAAAGPPATGAVAGPPATGAVAGPPATGAVAGPPATGAVATAASPAAAIDQAASQRAMVDLKAAGYTGETTPQALAAELAKRVLDPVSVDNAFLNAAMGLAHANNAGPALNTELGKIVEERAGKRLQGTSEEVSKAAKKAGQTSDNYLRGLIGLQNSDSAKKRSEDILIKGADQHRGTAAELVGEGALGVLKSIAAHPYKAAAIAAGVAAAPFVIGGAVALAGVAGFVTAATAASSAIGAVFAVEGAVKTYRGVRDIVQGNKLTGAERDEKLIRAGGELATGLPGALGAHSAIRGMNALRTAASHPTGPALLALPAPDGAKALQLTGPAAGAPSLVAPPLVPLLQGAVSGGDVAANAVAQAQAIMEAAKAVAFSRPPALPGPAKVVAPKPVDVSSAIRRVHNYDAYRQHVWVYTAKPGETLAQTLRQAQSEAVKINDSVWLEGSALNTSFPGKIISVAHDVRGLLISERMKFANEPVVAPTAAEQALEKVMAVRANALSKEVGAPVSFSRVQFKGEQTPEGLPVGRYNVGGNPTQKIEEVRQAAQKLGTAIDWGFRSRDGVGLTARVQPSGQVKVSVVDPKPEGMAALPQYLQSAFAETPGPIEIESVWASNQHQPFTINGGKLVKPHEAPAEVRAAFDAGADLNRGHAGFTADGGRPLDMPVPQIPKAGSGSSSAGLKADLAALPGEGKFANRPVNHPDVNAAFPGSTASYNPGYNTLTITPKAGSSLNGVAAKARALADAGKVELTIKVGNGRSIEFPDGSFVGAVNESVTAPAKVITAMRKAAIEMGTALKTELPGEFAQLSVVSLKSGELSAKYGGLADGRAAAFASAQKLSRSVKEPLVFISEGRPNVRLINGVVAPEAGDAAAAAVVKAKPPRGGNLGELERAAKAAADASAVGISKAQLGRWVDAIKVDVFPQARVAAGKGVELAPDGSTVRIISIEGPDAIVVAQHGSERIPLASLSSSTAAERGLTVGVEVSIKGNVAGAGEKGTVSALRGGQAEISISGGAAPARTVRVPLDYLERVTAASR